MHLRETRVFCHHFALDVLKSALSVTFFCELQPLLCIRTVLLEGLGNVCRFEAEILSLRFDLRQKRQGVFIDGLEIDVRLLVLFKLVDDYTVFVFLRLYLPGELRLLDRHDGRRQRINDVDLWNC